MCTVGFSLYNSAASQPLSLFQPRHPLFGGAYITSLAPMRVRSR